MTITHETIRNGNLQDVVAYLEARRAITQDVVVPHSQLRIDPTTGLLVMVEAMEGLDTTIDSVYELGHLASGQMASTLNVPSDYWKRMRADAVELLAENANYWLARSGKKFFMRALTDPDGGAGYVRALLSTRYRPMDDIDMAAAALEGCVAAGLNPATLNVKVDISEKRMWMRVDAPELTVAAPGLLQNYRDPRSNRTGRDYPGVSAGAVFSNSEVGQGAFTITPMVTMLVCTNGLTRPADGLRKNHLGAELAEGPVVWSDDTYRINIELVKTMARDAVASYMSAEYLEKAVAEMTELAGVAIDKPVEVIEKVSAAIGYTKDQADSIFGAFVKGGDSSAFGVVQAVTNVVLDTQNPDTAADLEGSAWKAGTLAAKLATVA